MKLKPPYSARQLKRLSSSFWNWLNRGWRRSWRVRVGLAVVVLIGVLLLQLIPQPILPAPKAYAASHQFTPTASQIVTGTSPNATSQATASSEGVNVGSWKGTLTNDNLHWQVMSTSSGYDANLTLGGVALNGGNTMFVQTEFDMDATVPATVVQICDWVSSSNVDGSSDAACTGGGWRTLNNRKQTITATSPTEYAWQIYDGYWSDGSNNPVSTPLTNFINSSNQSKVRFYSTTNTTTTVSIDYLKLQAVINPLYAAADFTIENGSTTGDYTNTTAVHQGASDDQHIFIQGDGASPPTGYFTFKNVKTYTGMNTALARFESSCDTTSSLRYQLKIRNFNTSSWDDMSGLVDCSTSEATHTVSKNNVTLSNYISGSDEIWLRFEGNQNSSNTIQIDQLYLQLGTTNTDTGQCEISFGSQTAGRIVNNPSTGSDEINGSDIDASYVYSVGYDSSGGDRQWRIEKRNKTTGALVSGFGNNGVVQSDPSSNDDVAKTVRVDGGYIYVGGTDLTDADGRYRVEKRDISTGALVSGFGSGGVFTSNPGLGGNDTLADIDIDENYIYILGGRSTNVWRYEKIDITTGAYDTGFDSDGYIENSSGSNQLSPAAIKIDADYIYAVGTEADNLGSLTSQQWRIEKRSLATGAYDTGFDSDGIVQSNPIASGADNAYDIDIDSTYMYIGGYQGGPSSNGRWRIEKRSLATGATADFGAASYDFSGSNDAVTGIKVWGTHIFATGYDGAPASTWRAGKFDNVTGSAVTAFHSTGYVQGKYKGDSPTTTLSIDSSSAYYFGISDRDSDGAWMMEKRDLNNGALDSSGFSTLSDCSATRDVDTTSANTNIWRLLTENESSNQGHDYYAFDTDVDSSAEEAAAANISFSATLGSSSQMTGLFYAGQFNGGIGTTVQLGAKDYSSLNNVTGGWTSLGLTASNSLSYGDVVTNGVTAAAGLQNNPGDYINTNTNSMNLRLRTSASGTSNLDAVDDLDFLMVSMQWVETATTPSRTHKYVPTASNLVTGTVQNVTATTFATAEGVNTGSWKGTLATDDFHWTFASTTGGMNAQLDVGNVALNGANSMIIGTRLDQDPTQPQTLVQICDWASSASVDHAADAQCTGGGWRTLNNRKNVTDTAVTTYFTWQISDGYWNDGTNTAVSTPLTNFVNGSNTVKVRYYSTTNTTSTVAIDYLSIVPVVNSIYTPSGFVNQGSGATTNTYSSTNGFVGALAGTGSTAQGPSDDSRLGWAGTAGSIADGYMVFKNVRTIPGMNTVSFRAEHRCSASGINYRPKIYNYSSSSWEDLSSSSIACSTTDATNVFAKNNVDLSNYINNGEVRVGWYGLSNGTQAIEIDQAYIMMGMVNDDTTTCSISFGTQNAGSCDNTRNIDTTASASTWDILAEDTSTNQGHDFYPYDTQVTASSGLEAKAAHVKMPVPDLTSGALIGYNWAGRYMSGTGGTVMLDIRDYAGKSNTEGGFKNVGSPVTSSLIYVDSVSITAPTGYSSYLINPEDHRDQLAGQSWLRLRTTSNSSAATNAVGQWDFAMIAPMWIERSSYTPQSNEQLRHGGYFRDGVEQPLQL